MKKHLVNYKFHYNNLIMTPLVFQYERQLKEVEIKGNILLFESFPTCENEALSVR